VNIDFCGKKGIHSIGLLTMTPKQFGMVPVWERIVCYLKHSPVFIFSTSYNEDFRFGKYNHRFGKLNHFHSNQLCIIIKYKEICIPIRYDSLMVLPKDWDYH
jgi:hypothetical protein